MRRRYRVLLTLGLMALSGAALAQGMGMGSGVDDLRPRADTGGPPPVTNFLLIQTGSVLLIDTGNRFLIQ